MRIELRKSLSAWKRAFTYLFRTAGTKLLAGCIQPVAQSLWKRLGCPPHLLKTPFLADPVGVNFALVLQLVRDCSVDLSQIQCLEFAQNRLRREAIDKALNH